MISLNSNYKLLRTVLLAFLSLVTTNVEAVKDNFVTQEKYCTRKDDIEKKTTGKKSFLRRNWDKFLGGAITLAGLVGVGFVIREDRLKKQGRQYGIMVDNALSSKMAPAADSMKASFATQSEGTATGPQQSSWQKMFYSHYELLTPELINFAKQHNGYIAGPIFPYKLEDILSIASDFAIKPVPKENIELWLQYVQSLADVETIYLQDSSIQSPINWVAMQPNFICTPTEQIRTLLDKTIRKIRPRIEKQIEYLRQEVLKIRRDPKLLDKKKIENLELEIANNPHRVENDFCIDYVTDFYKNSAKREPVHRAINILLQRAMDTSQSHKDAIGIFVKITPILKDCETLWTQEEVFDIYTKLATIAEFLTEKDKKQSLAVDNGLSYSAVIEKYTKEQVFASRFFNSQDPEIQRLLQRFKNIELSAGFTELTRTCKAEQERRIKQREEQLASIESTLMRDRRLDTNEQVDWAIDYISTYFSNPTKVECIQKAIEELAYCAKNWLELQEPSRLQVGELQYLLETNGPKTVAIMKKIHKCFSTRAILYGMPSKEEEERFGIYTKQAEILESLTAFINNYIAKAEAVRRLYQSEYEHPFKVLAGAYNAIKSDTPPEGLQFLQTRFTDTLDRAADLGIELMRRYRPEQATS